MIPIEQGRFPTAPAAAEAAPMWSGTPAIAQSINLRDIWASVYRSRWGVLAIFAVTLGLAILATLFIQPLFRAESTVEIKAETQKVLGTEEGSEDASSADASLFLSTQLDIIRSRATTGAVAQALGLYRDTTFLERMGYDADSSSSPATADEDGLRKAVNEVLQENLEVSFSTETRIAEINFSSPDPQLAAQVANSFADNYIRLNLARRFDASSYSLDFLREQIREAQARLADSQRAAIAYARNTRLIDASNAAGSEPGTAPASLTVASLVGLNTSLTNATARRLEAEGRWSSARSAALLTIPEVVQSPAVQQLQQQRAIAQAKLDQELQTHTEEYPEARELSAQITSLDRQIRTLANNVRSTIREDYRTAVSQEKALSDRLDSLKSDTLDEQNRAIQLSILRREVDTNREQLDALLKRYNELNAQSGIQLNNLAVIDRAEAPDGPYWPSLPLNIALGLVFGILGAAVYVLGKEHLFEMVRNPDDVSSRLRQPVLGSIPESDDLIVALADPKTPASEAFSTIRTNLALSSAGGVPKTFMITSTRAGEGKSSVAFGLANSLAKLGRRIVVIDCDLRRPNVHNLFDVPNTSGVSHLLAGVSAIDDVVLRNVIPNIDLITAGPIPPDPAELLAGKAFEDLVQSLSAQYDHVLVDSPPLLGLADAPLIATNVAGVVYVVESAKTSVRGAQTGLARVSSAGATILGVILSRFDPGQSGYGSDYGYAYQYSYSPEQPR